MRSRKFSIMAIAMTLLIGVSMIGTGVAAANGLIWSWSGEATVSVGDGVITKSCETPSVGSWSGNTWAIGTVTRDTTPYAIVRVTSTHNHAVTVKATAVPSGTCGVTSKWLYDGGSGYVDLPAGGITLSASSYVVLMLQVYVPADAPEGCSSTVVIGITAE